KFHWSTLLNIKNGKGLTPLDIAMRENDQDMARFLRENKAKTNLEIKVKLAALITLTIITFSLALVVYFIVKGIKEIAAQKTGSTLNDAESTKIEPPIKQK
ncbi:ankyrin repeat domain-containing protein, partial [Wolbachia endosymbiont of Bemisia tabaci]|uniref:ankyrin repeat domain-containing protein n=1 Tax=Wolbachia endosymbiont of Bemisia tabaci TaxID=215173 RepID=UPI0015D0D0C4